MKDVLGDRMKKNYENITRYELTRRTPVIIRLDGCHFHTFTRGMKKPFDNILADSMQEAMLALCENIQGCVLGYTQSDEISLLLIDYKELESDSWFNYNIQKLASVSAGIADINFNLAFIFHIHQLLATTDDDKDKLIYSDNVIATKQFQALFDSRCFNIPREEVVNYFYWRQSDAVRNSIQALGQSKFSSKELQGKNCNNIKGMLLDQYKIDWEQDVPLRFQRGSCAIKKDGKWEIDNEIPLFKDEGRNYFRDCYVEV